MQSVGQEKYMRTDDGLCCWAGCDGEGKFPAPKSPDDRKDLYYFCLKHIREYNSSWDYFRKMDMSFKQIDDFQKDHLTGHRPTWKFGVEGETSNILFTLQGIRDHIFENFRSSLKNAPDNYAENLKYLNLPKEIKEALRIFKLQYPTTLQEIKSQYKKLAKEHHPDLKKGSDDKIKAINNAYIVLKKWQNK